MSGARALRLFWEDTCSAAAHEGGGGGEGVLYESALARACALVLAMALIGGIACGTALIATHARRRRYAANVAFSDRWPFRRRRAEQMV